MIYERARIEKLIPGVWDEWRVLELPDDLRPDPDMPKTPQVDPRRSTDKVTELADIQRAWAGADLTLRQRQAVLLVYGLDMAVTEAATCLTVTQQTVSEHCFKGVTVLMHHLNGTTEEGESEDGYGI